MNKVILLDDFGRALDRLEASLPLGTFFRLAERFEQMPTLYSVDWVDLQRTSPVFRQSAIEQAITLHE